MSYGGCVDIPGVKLCQTLSIVIEILRNTYFVSANNYSRVLHDDLIVILMFLSGGG